MMLQPILTLEEIEELILERLPGILKRDPHFVTFIEGIVAEQFPRRDEFARLLDEMQQHRGEMAVQFEGVGRQFEGVGQQLEDVGQQFKQVDQRFERVEEEIRQHRQETAEQFKQVDQRFEQVDQRFDELEKRMAEGFHNVQVSIDRLGSRWGIRNESIFRQTMREVLEKSFDVRVEERFIGGEQFDCIISNGTHILVEISASVGKDILRKLQRKRQLYADETGVAPARFILAVGSIHSRRANALRDAGFEVIEPEADEE